jgi:hypothetical protein
MQSCISTVAKQQNDMGLVEANPSHGQICQSTHTNRMVRLKSRAVTVKLKHRKANGRLNIEIVGLNALDALQLHETGDGRQMGRGQIIH